MVFIDNKYTQLYYKIVNRAKLRNLIKHRNDGCQTHHIIPRSFGGNDTPDNLVVLTYREHKICHRLLIKMVSGPLSYKMKYAYVFFESKYDLTGIPKSESTKQKMRKPKSPEHAAKIRANNKLFGLLKRGTTAYNKGQTGEQSPLFQRPKSESTKQKMRKPKSIIKCPHCHQQGGSSQMKRWHFNNCKLFNLQ